ncbi:ion transporter [Agathobacter rectalis]|jgi:voltage-gated potassium channel|uniref:ion transporter n=2 Tax=Agathobacter TaxID=1766253 RepID=UPI0027D33DED|nr:ion transporter [Agathobacter rectalis]
MRKKIYNILNQNAIYDTFMFTVIIISIIPLAFVKQQSWMILIDRITVIIFIVDYILRWFVADKLSNKLNKFILYPLTPMAIIDLLSILPSITLLNSSFKLLKIFRLFRSLRLLKILKLVRYSKSITMICNVFKKQKETFITILVMAITYILVSALVIINVEPETFPTYFDALYWATISLTTVGYGDVYAVTTIGKIITMISSFLGIAVVALPAGIITSGLMDELSKSHDE